MRFWEATPECQELLEMHHGHGLPWLLRVHVKINLSQNRAVFAPVKYGSAAALPF